MRGDLCEGLSPEGSRESPLFRLVSQHIEEFLRVYEERFAREHGALRLVVEQVLREFLTCGLPEHGFARCWCSTCRFNYLVPFSCRGLSFCPSCEKKRSILWVEWLREEVLEPVPHRHVVVRIPRFLRRVFLKRRELPLDLSQSVAEALSGDMRKEIGEDSRPGVVVSIATAGDLLQWHPHGHVLVTDGAFAEDGAFRPLANWDGEALMRLFRERLLVRLVEKHALSRELATKLLSWRHPGFSAHVGEPIAPENTQAIEDIAGYVTRNPLSLKRLVYIDGQQAVIYKALKPNPTVGRDFESLDAWEWLARMSDHIPDPGRHRTLFCGHYANRVRGHRAAEEPNGAAEEKPAKKRRCSASWARPISKVYNVDPLTYRKCGGELKLVAYLHDRVAIKQILEHLGLSQPEDERPPPLDTRYVSVDEEGWEAEAP